MSIGARKPIEQVEVFHLLFLRALETRLDRGRYIVKGGVNLRAWFGSGRYSEDLDLDVVDCEVHVLRDAMDRMIGAATFGTLLRSQDLRIERVSRPKQMGTTQRWKFEIATSRSAAPLHTRVEFSRRGAEEPYVLEAVRSDVVATHGLPAPSANHYTAAAAIRQKIAALAGRAAPQARDIWDLDHLLRTTGADPRPLPPARLRQLSFAIDRVFESGFDAYGAQVVPFLTPAHRELFGTPDAWDRMRELVASRLQELGS